MGELTFIGADDTWALWTILAVCATLAIYLEQQYAWAGKVTGCILASVFTMALSNFGIIPTDAQVYDNVLSYMVPLAIPLLLFNADIKKIKKESGRAMAMYLLSSIGTIAGGFVTYFVLKNVIPELGRIIPMFVGTYTGGSVNLIALSQYYEVPGQIVSAAIVADNVVMIIYILVLISIPGLAIVKKIYRHTYEEEAVSCAEESENKNMAVNYWGVREISLKDMAAAVAIAFTIVTIATKISLRIKTTFPGGGITSKFVSGFLGNKYLIMILLIITIASIFPNKMAKIKGAQEIGTFFIYMFFAVIGAPASVIAVIKEAPLLLVVAVIIVAVNMVVSFTLGKIFNFTVEEIMVASNANIGGPTTAAAMAVSKGWVEFIIPSILIGTLGYVLGHYFGIFSGMLLV